MKTPNRIRIKAAPSSAVASAGYRSITPFRDIFPDSRNVPRPTPDRRPPLLPVPAVPRYRRGLRNEGERNGDEDANSRGRARPSPWDLPSSSFPTLSTSTSCQSSLHRRPSAAHPNAPLGAGLCIFNKFRESSKPVISAGGCQRRRLFGCLANGVLAFIYVRGVRNSPRLLLHVPPRPASRPPRQPSPFPLVRLCRSFRSLRSLVAPFSVRAQLAFHRSPPSRFRHRRPPSSSTTSSTTSSSRTSSCSSFPRCSSFSSFPAPFPPNPLPLCFCSPRFISARCQFEFGTRTTGQRVSTKNQFLNWRLLNSRPPLGAEPIPDYRSSSASRADPRA